MVQTAEGLPIYHEVFEGNCAETNTLLPTLSKVLARYPAMRRYSEFADLLQGWQPQCTEATSEITAELPWNGLRLVMAHDPKTALEQCTQRRARLTELERLAEAWAGKLDGQDSGQRSRGRRLSGSGAKARFYHAVCEAHMGQIVKVDLASDLFTYSIDEQTLKLAELMDGKLLMVTNVQDLTPEEIKGRYKALADIERGFKVLKSELEIGPVHHRLPERIRAHASICFMSLILHRVMHMRLRAVNAGFQSGIGPAGPGADPASQGEHPRRATPWRGVVHE